MTKTEYIEQMLDISDNQKEKIKTAMNNNTAVSIRIDNIGNDKIALTNGQINKINNSFQQNKAVTIKLSKAQLQYNKNHVDGGFLSFLARMAAPLAMKILPKIAAPLAHGALSALSSLGISKIFGSSLYYKKNGNVYKIKDMGSGIYLNKSNTKGLERTGDGIFLRNRENNEWVDGSGLISDITSYIPLLNLII